MDVSQDTLPSPLPIASLSKCCHTHCTTSDVYTTPVKHYRRRGSKYRILDEGRGTRDEGRVRHAGEGGPG